MAKIALFFHAFCGALTLGVGVALWWLARRFGMVTKVESFFNDYGTRNFKIHGDVIFKASIALISALVVVNVIATMLMAFLYNMLSGLLGGMVFSVLQEVPRPGTVAAELAAQAAGVRPEPTRKQRRVADREMKAHEKRRKEQGKQAATAQARARNAKATKVAPLPGTVAATGTATVTPPTVTPTSRTTAGTDAVASSVVAGSDFGWGDDPATADLRSEPSYALQNGWTEDGSDPPSDSWIRSNGNGLGDSQ